MAAGRGLSTGAAGLTVSFQQILEVEKLERSFACARVDMGEHIYFALFVPDHCLAGEDGGALLPSSVPFWIGSPSSG